MENELFILWTNSDPIAAEKMVFMYAHNAVLNHWWEKVTIIIWGNTAKLSIENEKLNQKIREMQNDGVKISACRACAEQLGVNEELEKMGVEVIYWGEPLTELIKKRKMLITI